MFQRNPALLPGKAQHHRVGEDAVAQQLAGDAFGVHAAQGGGVLQGVGDLRNAGFTGVGPVGVFDKRGRGRAVAVDDHMAAPGAQAHGRFFACGNDGVAANHQVRAGHAHTRGANGVLRFTDQHMAPGGAAFLRQAASVLGDDALAFHVRSHAQQLADGDDAGAAHASHHQAPDAVVRGGQVGDSGLGNIFHLAGACQRWRLLLAQAAAFHRDKARAKAFDARDVFVAGALVDLALAAKVGF